MTKAHVKVYVTKTLKFRASIKSEAFPHTTEVTVGGKKWNGDEFDPFRLRVLHKCKNIMEILKTELDLA